MPGGWLLRGIHHWTAQVMVVLLVLHLVQVVIDNAYRAPREFNFWFGLGLLFLTLGISLTGYLLPWDQKGFWATKVATNLAGIVPFIGDSLQRVIVGGTDYGNATLTRFFALHAGVLPGALVGLIVVHIYLFRRHGITEAKPATRASALYYWSLGAFILATLVTLAFVFNWGGDGKAWVPWVLAGVLVAVLGRLGFLIKAGKDDDSASRPKRDGMFWPDQIFRDAIACFAVMAAVLFFVFWKGTELMAPANPAQSYDAARPDWYFMSLFQMLEFEVFKGPMILVGAIIVPSILVGMVFLMPLIGKTSTGHWVSVVMLYCLIGGFIWLTALGFSHDANDPEFQADVAEAHAEAERVKELIEGNGGIPPEGALAMFYRDPLTWGPRIFASRCASCHAYDGHDGLGVPRKEEQVASDLHGFASREWVASMLDPEKILHVDYFGGTKFAQKSKMVDFVTEELADLDEDDKAKVAKVVKALSAEAGLRSQAAMDLAEAEAIKEGRTLMGEGEGDVVGFDCTSCHKFYNDGTKGPELTGYGSHAWLVDFIKNPEHKRFYGKRNDNMPAFGPGVEADGREREAILSDEEIGVVAEWLRGEWYVAPGKEPEIENGGAAAQQTSTEDEKPGDGEKATEEENGGN